MIVAAILLFWSLVYAGASATAIVRARAQGPIPPHPDDPRSNELRVVLVRPCAGSEPCLEEALRSSRGNTRVVFCVANESDHAFPIVSAIAREVGATVCVTGARGFNQKAQQIARALSQEAPSDVVVICDSDVVLRAGDLARLVDSLGSDREGAVAAWAAPVELLPSATMGDRIRPPSLAADLFPLLAGIDSHGMVGKLVAIRSEALEKSGGFAPLAAFLGEDMELARRLREHGSIVFARHVLARSHATQRSFGDTLARFTRWVQVIRAQRPALLLTYPLILAAWPLIAILAVASCAASPSHGAVALSALVIATLVRALVGFTSRRILGRTEGTILGDMIASDVALLFAFARAVCSRTVMWRGNRLLLGKNGALQ